MQRHPQRPLELGGELRARSVRAFAAARLQEREYLWRELQRAAAPRSLVQQPDHPRLLERRRDQIERRARVAVRAGRGGRRLAAQHVRAQHLVLHLHLVERREEPLLRAERRRGHSLRRRVQQPRLLQRPIKPPPKPPPPPPDGETLQTLVRNNPLRAAQAHVGIVGHITKDELLRYLTATELANGFFNRFLVLAVDRSKLLPFGSAIDNAQLAEIRDAVRLALRFAGLHRPLAFDNASRERWIDVYPELSASQPGLAGAATARAEAHVVRLALIYALLDCSERIRSEHLDAGLAVWRYSADSARWIFGDSLGDPTADEIWAAAKERPAGVTRTEVSDMFSRNKKRREIERALTVLEDAGRLRRETRPADRGRPAEIWMPVLADAA